MLFQIKCRFSARVLFEGEFDSLRLTLEAAVKARANLGGADLGGARLGGADLGGADLGGAYLRGAYLGGAYLGGADLGGANLGGADLGGADLGGADLGGAYLGGADLGGAYLRGAKIRNGITVTRVPLQISGLKWSVTIWDEHMQIGCEFHSLADWASFDDRRIEAMDGRDALKFWRAHKAALLALAESDGRGVAKKEAA